MLKSLLLILACVASSAFAQTAKEVEQYLPATWKLDYLVEDGVKIPAPAENKNDRMFFYSDHRVKSIEGAKTETGKWSYNETTHVLTIIDDATGEKFELYIVSISSARSVFREVDDTENTFLIHMVPVE